MWSVSSLGGISASSLTAGLMPPSRGASALTSRWSSAGGPGAVDGERRPHSGQQRPHVHAAEDPQRPDRSVSTVPSGPTSCLFPRQQRPSKKSKGVFPLLTLPRHTGTLQFPLPRKEQFTSPPPSKGKAEVDRLVSKAGLSPREFYQSSI